MQDLIQQAVQLRQAQAEKDQRRFHAFPRHVQHTLFHDQAVLGPIRLLPLDLRLAEAERRKKSASDKIRQAQALSGGEERRHLLSLAAHEYEQCYSIFSYLCPRSDAWRERGIRDEDFVEHLIPRMPRDDAVGQILESTLCSYAITLREEGDVRGSRQALDEAFLLRGHCSVRPAFLLAKLLTEQASSTTVDLEQAVRYLVHSTTQCTQRTAAWNEADALLARLQLELKTLNERDRRRFRGIADALAPSPNEPGAKVPAAPASEDPGQGREGAILRGSWYEQAEQARRVIAQLRADGEAERAESMWRDLQRAAVEKLFYEALLPNNVLDVRCALPPKVEALATRLELDLRSASVLSDLERVRGEHYCTKAVDSLCPLDVEMMLLRAGLVDVPVVCTASPLLPPSHPTIQAQRQQLKAHRRSLLGL